MLYKNKIKSSALGPYITLATIKLQSVMIKAGNYLFDCGV